MSGPCEKREGQGSDAMCKVIRTQGESFQCRCAYPGVSGRQCRVARVAEVVMELVYRGYIPGSRIGEATRIAVNTIPRVVERNGELV